MTSCQIISARTQILKLVCCNGACPGSTPADRSVLPIGWVDEWHLYNISQDRFEGPHSDVRLKLPGVVKQMMSMLPPAHETPDNPHARVKNQGHGYRWLGCRWNQTKRSIAWLWMHGMMLFLHLKLFYSKMHNSIDKYRRIYELVHSCSNYSNKCIHMGLWDSRSHRLRTLTSLYWKYTVGYVELCSGSYCLLNIRIFSKFQYSVHWKIQ